MVQQQVNRKQCLENLAYALECKAQALRTAASWQNTADHWTKIMPPEETPIIEERSEQETMQDLLDQARNTRFGPDFGNPWKWDYEGEAWTAVDSDGVLWTSDDDVAVKHAL